MDHVKKPSVALSGTCFGRAVLTALALGLLTLIPVASIDAQSNDDCMMCHEDPELVGTRNGAEVSVAVDPKAFAASVHADFSCIDCHMELDGA